MRLLVSSGIFLCFLWGVLAIWSNQALPVPIIGMLSIQALAWGTVLWTWKQQQKDLKKHKSTILGLAILMRIPSFFATPIYEDDYFRFLWDGWNFITKGSPYLGPPEKFFDQPGYSESLQSILYNVNYPEVPTIYPPACQIFFALAALIGPLQLWALRLVLLCVELSSLLIFFRIASAKQLLLLAWCPLLVFECTFQVHPDFLGASLLLLAFYARQRKAPLATGFFSALALGIKVTALPALPFLLWPLHKKSLLGFLATLTLMYLPFFLQGSKADFDGLIVFSRDWEFNASLYSIGSTILPKTLTKLIMLSLFSLVFFLLWFFWQNRGSTQHEIPKTLVVIYGTLFLVSPVVNSWYLLWILPFVCLAPRHWSITALIVTSLSYIRGQTLLESSLDEFSQPLWIQILEYSLVLALATGSILSWAKKARTIKRVNSKMI